MIKDKQREAFEAWHNEFYGPQDKYNPIRSLAYDSYGVGLGYDDWTVQAQFVAFCAALSQLQWGGGGGPDSGPDLELEHV